MMGSLMAIGALLVICGTLYWKQFNGDKKDYVPLKHKHDNEYRDGYATFDNI